MHRHLDTLFLVLGLLALAWVGAGQLNGPPLALALVLLIAAAYTLGLLELRRYRADTRGLVQALSDAASPPPELEPWLARVPAALRSTVRLRLEGEPVALPGPALAPALAGLLVLLGMLGTFVGMVITLGGTGTALAQASDATLIRDALVAPVRGLGLAFGTSVAGVAASALLGLATALARRERQQAGRSLDTALAGLLRPHTRAAREARQSERALQLMQTQSELLPALLAQMQALVSQSAGQAEALHEGLQARQAEFHAQALRATTELAASVDRSLKDSLSESARLAGAALAPAVQATLAGLAQESATLRETLGSAVQRQIEGVGARLDAGAAQLGTQAQEALAHQQRLGEALAEGLHARLQAQGDALLQRVGETHAGWDAALASRERERLEAFQQGLAAQAASQQAEAERRAADQARQHQALLEALAQRAQAATDHAEARARATLDEIGRLVQAAAEAPRAAAELVGQLRQSLSDSLAHDNAVLQERQQLLGTLAQLMQAVNHASTEQREAIDALVRTSSEVLERAGQGFAAAVAAQSGALEGAAAQLGGGAAEVASLGEGFGLAVERFCDTSERLGERLQGIEAALSRSMARSDEQLAYYVAQAREIIDLSLGSHKTVIDELQQLARPPAVLEADAA